MARVTRKDLQNLAAECAVGVTYYNPGDGTKYRVHRAPGADYFDGSGIFTGTAAECRAFILGVRCGRVMSPTFPALADITLPKGGDA